MDNATLGDIVWLDLTVENAGQIRDFYQQVIGWQVENVSMGEYNDYSMLNSGTQSAVSGICHARGSNSDLPPMWLPYFLVEDVEQAARTVQSEGGTLVTEVKSMGKDKFVVIKDPAGAACALYQQG